MSKERICFMKCKKTWLKKILIGINVSKKVYEANITISCFNFLKFKLSEWMLDWLNRLMKGGFDEYQSINRHVLRIYYYVQRKHH